MPRAGLTLFCQRAARRRSGLILWCNRQSRARAGVTLSCAAQPRIRAGLTLSCAAQPRIRAGVILSCAVQSRARAGMILSCQRANAPLPAQGFDVRIAGQNVSPLNISITADADQIAITATLDFADALPVELWPPAAVEIALGNDSYVLLGESYARSRAFASRTWTLTASSPAARLQGRYAPQVQGELSGLASSIATRLAGDVALNWRLIDWTVQPLRLVATGQDTLELLRTLVSAVGGALISAPDGTLDAVPWPPYTPADWAAHADTAVDSLQQMVSVSDSADERQLCNAVTVSAETPAANTLRIEEDRERRMGAVTEVLVYQTPWADDFDLTHRGDPGLVLLANLGVEERTVTEELIEIQEGKGRTQYPIYSLGSARWNRVNLGGLTYSENGTIETAITGESLLYLTYKTKARRWRVSGQLGAEPLLLVVRDGEGA